MTEKTASDFFKRSDLSRAMSVMMQVTTIMRLPDVKSVLEIGPGRGNSGSLLKSFGIDYESVDTDDTFVQPTYLSEFHALTTSKTFDVVAAFQVFEHNPRKSLQDSLRKCAEISDRFVVISLPYSGNYLSVSIRGKFFDRNRLSSGLVNLEHVTRFPVLFPARRSVRSRESDNFSTRSHQWEVGDRGCTVRQITEELASANLDCLETFLNPYYPYHCFFVARIKR